MKNFGAFFRTVRYLRLSQILSRVDYRFKCYYYRSPFYPLFTPVDDANLKLLVQPPLLWSGQKKMGEELLKHQFNFIGTTLSFGKDIRWKPTEASALWIYNLHYFHWLNDLKKCGNEGHTHARDLIHDWLQNCDHFDQALWHPYPLSLRIANWLTHAHWLLKGSNKAFQSHFMESLNRQINHLHRTLEWDVGGNHLIKNLKALIYAGLILENRQSDYLEGIRLLIEQLRIQVLNDGGHYERSPHYHLDVLKDLLDIHALLRKSGQTPPIQLTNTIDKMAAALAFYTYPDGQLGLFNDGSISSKKEIDAVLKQCGGVEEVPDQLKDSGYARLEKKGTMLMVDGGLCCPDELPAHAHADMLSFELCVDKERIFVNSGTYAYQHSLRNEFRGTAAHNTVTLDKSNSAEVWSTFRLGRRPKDVHFTLRHEEKSGLRFIGDHDGYKHKGANHKRKIFLSEDGKSIVGEDIITAKKPLHTLAMFHLHPKVRYTLKTDNEVEIKSEKNTFSFKISGGRLYDSQSQYAPEFGKISPNRLLLIRGNWKKDKCKIKWALVKN